MACGVAASHVKGEDDERGLRADAVTYTGVSWILPVSGRYTLSVTLLCCSFWLLFCVA